MADAKPTAGRIADAGQRVVPELGSIAKVAAVWDFLRNGEQALDRVFDRYGDVVAVSVPRFAEVLPGVYRAVLLRDPDLVKPLFTAPDEQVDSTTANRVLEMLYGGRSLFLIDGPQHRRLRKLLLPRLRGDELERWREAIVHSTAREVLQWRRQESVRLHPQMLHISLELILKITLDITDQEMARWTAPMHALLEMSASDAMTYRYAARKLGGLKRWKKFQQALAECNDLVFEEIARRRSEPGHEHADLLDLMLRSKGEPLSDSELRDQIFTVLIAGHETSATTVSWAIERLIRTPAAYDKAVAEARGSEEGPYLEAVIHEALRLRPPVAVVGRITRKPFTLGAYQIPEGVGVVPVIRSIHRKHELYSEPEQFRPERFLAEKPGIYTLIPFGGGQHRCLGDRLAIFQATLTLRTVLRHADLTVVNPLDEEIKLKAIAHVPGELTHVRVRTPSQPSHRGATVVAEKGMP